MRHLLLAAGLLAVASCHHDKPPAAPRMVIERRPCIDHPPPEPIPGGVTYDSGGHGDCAPGYVMCLPMEAAKNLVLYVSALHDWARDSFTACGPPQEPTPPEPAKPAAPASGETL